MQARELWETYTEVRSEGGRGRGFLGAGREGGTAQYGEGTCKQSGLPLCAVPLSFVPVFSPRSILSCPAELWWCPLVTSLFSPPPPWTGRGWRM